MKTKVNNPNLRLLTVEELKETSGGASDSASMTMSSGTDTLLSMDFKWQQGDDYKEYKIEAGKDVNFNLNAFGNGASNAS